MTNHRDVQLQGLVSSLNELRELGLILGFDRNTGDAYLVAFNGGDPIPMYALEYDEGLATFVLEPTEVPSD